MQFIFFQVLFKRIKAIRYFLRDKEVAWWKKVIIIVGIVYLLSPIDFIPEPVLIFGAVDDIVLWTFIIWYLKDELDNYWTKSGPVKAEEKFRGKNIVDDVDFVVTDETVEEEERETHG